MLVRTAYCITSGPFRSKSSFISFGHFYSRAYQRERLLGCSQALSSRFLSFDLELYSGFGAGTLGILNKWLTRWLGGVCWQSGSRISGLIAFIRGSAIRMQV